MHRKEVFVWFVRSLVRSLLAHRLALQSFVAIAAFLSFEKRFLWIIATHRANNNNICICIHICILYRNEQRQLRFIYRKSLEIMKRAKKRKTRKKSPVVILLFRLFLSPFKKKYSGNIMRSQCRFVGEQDINTYIVLALLDP